MMNVKLKNAPWNIHFARIFHETYMDRYFFSRKRKVVFSQNMTCIQEANFEYLNIILFIRFDTSDFFVILRMH